MHSVDRVCLSSHLQRVASTRAEALVGVILLNSNEKGKGGSNYLQRVATTAGKGQTPKWGVMRKDGR